MYDIRRALKKFHRLIKWVAYQYSNQRNYLMEYEDLEAEGLLVLVKCCDEFPESELELPDGETRFAHYFKRALYNKMKKFIRHSNYKKRVGQVTSLEAMTDEREDYEGNHYTDKDFPERLKVYQRTESEKFMELMRDRIDVISPYLSEDSARLLQMLVNPNDGEVLLQARKDWKKKRRLKKSQKFRVRWKHVRGILNMSTMEVSTAIREIKTTNQLLSKDVKLTTGRVN